MTSEYVTEKDIRDLIKSENVNHLGTENGFSLAIGFDESDLPHEKCRSMIGNESIIDVMDRVLVEKLKTSEKTEELLVSLDVKINELDKRLSHWTNCTPMGNSAYNMLMRELEVYREIKNFLKPVESKSVVN